MTDTIEWGEPDPDSDDDGRPRGRRRRLTGWAAVGAVLLAVGAAVATPPVQRHLSDGTARWLAQRWAERDGLLAARAAVFTDFGARAASTDGPTVVAGKRAVDAEVADALEGLARRVGRRRMWGSDVRAAAAVVRSALRMQARDLRSYQPLGDASVFEGQPATAALAARAGALVHTMLVRRHLHPPVPAAVRLRAAGPTLRRLARPTDVATGLRLVAVVDGPGVRIVDLDSGRVDAYPGLTPAGGDAWPVVVGSRLLVSTGDGRFELLGLDGARSIRLPAAVGYLPAGTDGLWQLLDHNLAVRRLDDQGRPVSAPVRVPAGYEGWRASAGDDVLITPRPELALPEELWDPLTGRVSPAPAVCSIGSAGSTVAVAGCNPTTGLTVSVAGGRRLRRFVPPPGTSFGGTDGIAVSPDGTRLAAAVQDRDDAGWVVEMDVGSGRVTQVPGSAGFAPVGWSSDGQWLLLGPTADLGTFSNAQDGVMLWRSGDRAPMSVRLPEEAANPRAVGLLPTRG